MNIDFDFDRMETLLRQFNRISGVRYSLLDTFGKVVCFSSDMTQFCEMMNASKEGHARCVHCDADAIEEVKRLTNGYLVYRCHAGLIEVIVPVRQHGKVLAYIVFGQLASDGELAENWNMVRHAIAWHPAQDAFREPFEHLLFMNDLEIDSCAQILDACSAYIWMEGVIRTAFMSDEQILNAYISEHYTEQLALADISKALSISTTKLCGIAAKQGSTVNKMILQKRIVEAKRYLKQGSMHVADIASLVGISDYNYFTRIFKASTGETPNTYRKRHQRECAKTTDNTANDRNGSGR